MDYRLENIDDSTFEELINTICKKILGAGVIEFSTGKDGGRDGKFTGTAQNYPSQQSNWKGKFIIQAKHTQNPIASCSDKDFERIITSEIKKIKTLKAAGQIDNYLLFTNRKYPAIKGEKLLQKIKTETQLDNCVIIGKETINNQYLNSNKDIVRQFHLDLVHIPFDFSDEEIKNIIIVFREQLPNIKDKIAEKAKDIKRDFTYLDKTEKNKKNGLTEDYFQQFIVAYSLAEFQKIETFLNDPINATYRDYYFDTARELNQIIFFKRDNFENFEEIFHYVYKLICDGAEPLKGSKRYVTTFLHYMYFECLIGKK